MRSIPTPRDPRKSPDSADLTEVPAVIRHEAEGVHSLTDWIALGEQRRLIRGITRKHVKLVLLPPKPGRAEKK